VQNQVLLGSASNNKRIGSLVLSSSLSESLVAPSVDRTLTASNRRFGFTTTVWVVSWRLDNTTNVGSSSLTSALSSLTKLLVLVLSVTNFTNGGAASVMHHAHFAGWQSERHIVSFLSHHLSGGPSGTDNLSALSWLEFDVVNQRTKRDVLQHETVARQNVGPFSATNLSSHSYTLWCENVSLLTIGVLKQGDAARSVWIVFDRSYRRVHRVFLSLKVDDSILSLASAALVEARDSAVVVTSAALLQTLG
jgi:hypothetical protein